MTQSQSDKEDIFLTYLVFKDNQKMLGHSAVGITKKNPDGTFRLIFRVGLFPTHQVQMEDFILDKTGREFYCKHFPITLEEQTLILSKINADRRTMTDSPKNPENKHAPLPKQSVPGGKTYHTYFNNCKDYALSLLAYARKDYRDLSNMGVSIPRWSGKLDAVCIEKTADGTCIIHPHGTKGYYIEKLRQYIDDRTKQSASYLSKFASYFSGFHRTEKLSAAQKVLLLLSAPDTDVSFSAQEYRALQQGRLGGVVRGLMEGGFINLDKQGPEQSPKKSNPDSKFTYFKLKLFGTKKDGQDKGGLEMTDRKKEPGTR